MVINKSPFFPEQELARRAKLGTVQSENIAVNPVAPPHCGGLWFWTELLGRGAIPPCLPHAALTRKKGGPSRAALQSWSEFSVFKLAGPLEVLQFDHGQSNLTYYIRLADHQLVLRKKPPGTLLPLAHAVEREFR